MKARTELVVRRASRIAAWAIIVLFGVGCAIGILVSVIEHPIARTLFLAILGLFALTGLAIFVLWAIGDVNRKKIEELEQSRHMPQKTP